MRQPVPRNITHSGTPEHPVQIRPQQPAATQTDTAQSESHPAGYHTGPQLQLRQSGPAGKQKTQPAGTERLPLRRDRTHRKLPQRSVLGNPAIRCRCQPAGQQIQRRLQQSQPDSL